MKKKITKILGVIIVICIAAAIIITKRVSLDNPVFLKNCREVQLPEENQYYSFLDIFYIGSSFDKDKVSKVTFKELPDLQFEADEFETDPYMKSINKVHLVNIYSNKKMHNYNLEGKVLKNAILEFTSGKIQEVELGEIYLYKGEETDSLINILSYKSSSDNMSSIECKVNDNVKITSVKSPYLEESKDVFEFNVSALGYNEETHVFDKEEGDMYIEPYVTFSAQYKCNDLMKKYTYYDIRPKVYFTNENMYSYSLRTSQMSNREEICYGSKYDIYKYLKEIGEI